MADDGKKGSMVAQIMTSVVIALLVGGTSPWWFTALTGKGKAEPTPVPQHEEVQRQPTLQPIPGQAQPQPVPAATQTVAAEPALTPSREFFVGRWRVDQEMNGVSSETNIDYYGNGRYEGARTMANAFQGQRANITGVWTYERLSDKLFRITFSPDGGYLTIGKYKILDRNHIQEVDENYVAERVE